MSGIAYSALMLGVLLPKLNIWMTKHNKKFNLNPFKKAKAPEAKEKEQENNKNFSGQFKSNLKYEYFSTDKFQQLIQAKQKSYNL